jgi:hypothetical protein
MLDDFNDGVDPNNWGGVKNTVASGSGAAITAGYDPLNAYGGTGYSLKVEYSVPNAANYGTLYIPLRPDWGGVDVSTYTYISFRLRGTGAEQSFKLQLVSSDNGNKSAYITVSSGTVSEWSADIKVRLDSFPGVDLTKLNQVNFIFEHDYFAGKGYPYAGAVNIDNLEFKFN